MYCSNIQAIVTKDKCKQNTFLIITLILYYNIFLVKF